MLVAPASFVDRHNAQTCGRIVTESQADIPETSPRPVFRRSGRFDFLQQKDDPSRFVLCEVYRDADAPAKHKQTAHYNAWVEAVSDMFEEPRTRAFYTNIFPADQSW